MKVLYVTYENVYRTGILQAMVIKPLAILSNRYNVEFTILSTLKENEKDSIYEKNKMDNEKIYPFLKIIEFEKKLTESKSVLTFITDLLPLFKFVYKESKKYDIIHCRGYGGALIGVLCNLFSKKSVIFDMRGTLPEEIVDLGRIKRNSLKFKLLKLTEKFLIKKSNVVFTVSNAFKQYVEASFNKVNVININNPTDFSSYTISSKKTEKINFIYSGSVQPWHMPELTLSIFSKVYQSLGDKVFLIFCTNDIHKAERLFKSFNLPKDSYELNSVPFSEMPKYYHRSNIAFCLIKDSFSKSVCFPVKFSEYIASELYVIANKNIGDLESIIENYKCGIILDLDMDTKILVSQVIELTNKLISDNKVSYNRDDLGFLDWKREGIEIIYNTYLKIN